MDAVQHPSLNECFTAQSTRLAWITTKVTIRPTTTTTATIAFSVMGYREQVVPEEPCVLVVLVCLRVSFSSCCLNFSFQDINGVSESVSVGFGLRETYNETFFLDSSFLDRFAFVALS